MKRVLVLGISGMLGHMVFNYLKNHSVNIVFGTTRDIKLASNRKDVFHFDVITSSDENLSEIICKAEPDIIINNIGIINKYCNSGDWNSLKTAVEINTFFPHKLSHIAAKTAVIQIATDCVYSGRDGKYSENSPHDSIDIYGKTKSLGEVIAPNWLNIRTSIIGPEIKNKVSLLEWFLSAQPNAKLEGYNNHIWNGMTTLQFAQLLQGIILGDEFNKLRALNHVLHYAMNESVSKYELLRIFNTVFKKTVEIYEVEAPGGLVDRTLQSEFISITKKPMYDAIEELKDYMVSEKYQSISEVGYH